jgi:hypothetical protein
MSEGRVYEFQVAAGRTAEDLMAQAKGKARDVGIAIAGDATGGRFEGTAEGRYVVDGRVLRVEVDRKPAYVPWRIVESGLRRMFG